MIGKVISHYKILEKLGGGGMGVVYKAEDTKLERLVALKFLPAELTSDIGSKQRFVQEARAASSLQHNNICTIHDINETPDGQLFICMDYYKGETLKYKIARGPLPVEKVLNIVQQIAEGLSKAHEAGIVHRDIKPANIIVTNDGVVKIVDFGLAKLTGMQRLTNVERTVGTIAYMSPEQITGEDSDHRSDIFSLGIILYELLTGELPFTGDYEAAVMYRIIHNDPEPLAQYRQDLLEGTQQALDRMLAKRPDRRYQNANEVVTDLKLIQQDSDVVATKSPPKKWSKFLLMVPVVVLAAILVFIIKPYVSKTNFWWGASAEENSLAIMYFENLADRDDPRRLGEIITNLLIDDLSESAYLRVVSSQRLYDILKLKGKEGIKIIDRSTATEVASQAKAKWMLLGSILQEEPNYIVTSQLIEVKKGDVFASQRVTGETGEKIFSLVDKLTREIKNDMSLPAAARTERDLPIAEVTTHSAEAYRFYIEGLDNYNRVWFSDAVRSFQRAVEYDSTLALAHYWLADPWIRPGVIEEKKRSLSRAIKYSNHMGKKEKKYLVSRSDYLSGDIAGAVKELEDLIDEFPYEKQAIKNLAWIYFSDFHDPRHAISLYRRALEIDPLDKITYNNLAYIFEAAGEADSSIWAINKYVSIAPDEPNPYDSRGDLYAFDGQIDKAIESYQKAIELKADFNSHEKLGHMYLFKNEYDEAEAAYRNLLKMDDADKRERGRLFLAYIPLYQGRLRDALQILNDGVAADVDEGFKGIAYRRKLFLLSAIYDEQNDLISATAEFEKLLSAFESQMTIDQRLQFGITAAGLEYYVYLLARRGELHSVEMILDSLRESSGNVDLPLMRRFWLAQGLREMVRNQPERACIYFEKAAKYNPEVWTYRYPLALACLKAEHLARAVKEFEGLLKRYSFSRADNAIWAVKAYYYLGVAYEKSGWLDEAAEKYTRFLEIWKHADPGIEEVEDARRRLGRLE